MKTKNMYTYILWALCVIMAFANIFPYAWLALTAFKRRYEAVSVTPTYVFEPTLDNFMLTFVERGYTNYLINSAIIATGSTILVVVLALPAAYTFSRFKLKGDNHIYFVTLTTRMGPGILIALPLYLLFSKMGLWDTHLVLILAHAGFNLALAIWLFKGFIDEIPTDLDEAAWLDRCSPVRTLFSVILPACGPGIAVTTIFCFIMSWNEFLYAVLLTGNQAKTLPVAVAGLVTPHGTLWQQIAAVAFITTVPIICVVYFLQRYLARGLTFGAVK